MASFTTTRNLPCFVRSSLADVKQNNHNVASYLHSRSCKTLGLLGLSLLTKLAIVDAVATRLVICKMIVIYVGIVVLVY